MNTDVGPVEPGAVRLVRSEPAALDDLAEGMIHVIEVEIQTQRGGCADHAIAIQSDELAVLEQLHVLQVVAALEALFFGQRGETDALQFLELHREFRTGVRDHQAVSKFSVIPAHCRKHAE